MPMKVTARLDLGRDFNRRLQVRIDDIVVSYTAESCPDVNKLARMKGLIDEVRTIALQAYSLGVEQGKKEASKKDIPKTKKEFDI